MIRQQSDKLVACLVWAKHGCNKDPRNGLLTLANGLTLALFLELLKIAVTINQDTKSSWFTSKKSLQNNLLYLAKLNTRFLGDNAVFQQKL